MTGFEKQISGLILVGMLHSIEEVENGVRNDILPLTLLIVSQSSKNENKNVFDQFLPLLLKS